MSLSRHPTLDDVWIARVYVEGRKKDSKTGKANEAGRKRFYRQGTEAEALKWYASLLRSPKKETSVPLAPTLTEAWAKFCAYYEQATSETTFNDYLKTWNRHLKPFFGQFRPMQLTPDLIDNYKVKRQGETYLPGKNYQLPKDDTEAESKRRKPVSKKRIQNELYYISAMCSWMALPEVDLAQPLHFKIKGYPAKDTKAPLPVVPGKRDVIWLIRNIERKFRPMLLIWYYGGLRKSELLPIKAEQINAAYWYMIVRGKGDKERIVPIHRKIKYYIRKFAKSGYLFVNPKTKNPYVDISKNIKRAAIKAGLSQRVYLHLLRHCFGTHGIESGINPRAMQLLLGHSSMKTTEIYTTLAAGTLTSEMAKFGGKGPEKREHDLMAMMQELMAALRPASTGK